VELYQRAGLAVASDPAAARDAAEKQVLIERALASLRGVVANAAYLLHADGAPKAAVKDYMRRYLVMSPDRAAKQIALVDDPISRAEVAVASEGERLLRRWFELGPESERVDRFGRLLREQLTPRSLAEDVASAGYGEGGF